MHRIRLYRLIVLVLICFGNALHIQGQLQKGDRFIDFSVLSSYSNSPAQEPNIRVDATYLQLVSERVMIGGRLLYHHTPRAIIRSNALEFFVSNTYALTPTLRYYFTTNKLAFFASLENVLLHVHRNTDVLSQSNTTGYRAELGVGFNYFLNDYVAIETLAKVNAFETDDLNINALSG